MAKCACAHRLVALGLRHNLHQANPLCPCYNYYIYATQKPTIMLHFASCILLDQLIATLVHYLCTVALMGLDDWFAFLELVLPNM